MELQEGGSAEQGMKNFQTCVVLDEATKEV
jgi:hypothetical protein